MNKTEAIAFEWLKKKYPKVEFKFNPHTTPDFFGSDGSMYEVKLIGYASVIIGNSQAPILERLNPTILVFYSGETEPSFIFKYKDFPKELRKVISKPVSQKAMAIQISTIQRFRHFKRIFERDEKKDVSDSDFIRVLLEFFEKNKASEN